LKYSKTEASITGFLPTLVQQTLKSLNTEIFPFKVLKSQY
jgi:hypothetical protein